MKRSSYLCILIVSILFLISACAPRLPRRPKPRKRPKRPFTFQQEQLKQQELNAAFYHNVKNTVA